MTKTIDETVARKVLQTVDAGLVAGVGVARLGYMCVEAAVCYAMGEDHGGEPSCVDPVLRAFKINLNDSSWSSPNARAKGMRRLAVIQLGSRGMLDQQVFVKHLVALAKKWAAAAAAARYAAAAAAAAVDAAARYAARDKVLSEAAEDVVQVLIQMGVPGAQWLYLTE